MKLNLIKNDVANDFKPIESPRTPFDVVESSGLAYNCLLNKFDQYNMVKSGWHYIAPGAVGLTYFSSTLEFAFGIGQNIQKTLVEPVNIKKETRTLYLYPAYNITILPIGDFSVEEKEKHLIDALISEIEYVESGKLLFDFRDFREGMIFYRNTLHRFLGTKYSKFDWDCYMYSYDNSEF